MDRRALLATIGTVGTGLLAGCTGEDGGDQPSDSPSPTPTTTSTGSPTGTPCETALQSTAFDVRSVECGNGENSADASVDPTGAATPDGETPTYTVTVTGTIDGRNTCHSARLRGVDPLPEDDTLRVSVESYVPDSKGDSACGQCLVDVDYEATVAFACGYYGVVVVVHDGEEVAEIPLPE